MSTPKLIKSFNGDAKVTGLAILERKLYVIRCNCPRIDVFDADEYAMKHQLEVKIANSPSQTFDLASCSRSYRLYLSNKLDGEIYRLDPSDGSVTTRWTAGGCVEGIAVRDSCNLLVTCGKEMIIDEFTPEGVLVHHIDLTLVIQQVHTSIVVAVRSKRNRLRCMDMIVPYHCIEADASSGISVSFSSQNKQIPNMVCMLDEKGDLVTSTARSSQTGSGEIMFDRPSHLAVDSRHQILVADTNNNRIRLLGPSLEHIHDLITSKHGLKKPVKMCIDGITGRLLVANENGTLLVFQAYY